MQQKSLETKNYPLKKQKTSPKIKMNKVTNTQKQPKSSKKVLEVIKDLFVFPKYDYNKQKIKIFAGDPGIKNFGYSIFEINSSFEVDLNNMEKTQHEINTFLQSIQIIECGFLRNCITELRYDNIIPYLQKFHESNANIYSSDPDYLVLERYQARDLRGPRNEVINILISALITKFHCKPNNLRNARLLIPSQWKRFYTLDPTNQNKGLDLIYDKWKKDKYLKRKCKLTDHQTDAFLMGVYYVVDSILKDIKDPKPIRELIVNYLIENTSQYFTDYFSNNNLK